MPQSFVNLQYHLIFSTKDRTPWLTPELRPRLYAYLGGIFRSEGGVLTVEGGVADHVHLLASISKERAVSETLRDIKSNSTGWIHDNFSHLAGFAWQKGYSAFTIGRTEIEAVTRYIWNQE